MAENTTVINTGVNIALDINQCFTQLGNVLKPIPMAIFGDYLIKQACHKSMCEKQTEQDKIAITNGLAYYDYSTKQLIYFKDIDDPKLKLEARKEADREQQQEKLFGSVCEELETKNIKPEDLGIAKDSEYFYEEFFHYWDKYSDDMRRDDLRNLWAKILVQEMQKPHTISIRTMEFVKTLSKRDANIFNIILPYVINNSTIPHIYNVIHSIDLQHLEHLGLLLGNRGFPLEKNNSVSLGKEALTSDKFQFYSYSLSDIGKELYLIADVGEYDFDKLEEAFDNDNLVKIGDKMSFHKMLNKTQYNTTPFKVYQKKEQKDNIEAKYNHLPRLSLAPNI